MDLTQYQYLNTGLFLLGLLLVFLGYFIIIKSNSRFFSSLIVAFGACFIIASWYLGDELVQQGKEAILQDLAEKLNVDASEVIIEDISEHDSNENLRRVYYQNKVYIIEIENYKVIKVVDQK